MLRTLFDALIFAALIATIYVGLNFACLLNDKCTVASGLL